MEGSINHVWFIMTINQTYERYTQNSGGNEWIPSARFGPLKKCMQNTEISLFSIKRTLLIKI